MNNQNLKRIAQSFFSLYKNVPNKILIFFFALFFQAEAVADVVGSVPGSFSVSPSGSASYNIPIEVPKGVNEMQPDLSFVYDSQSGNGLLGMGWGLAGLSAITRCPKNYAQDYQINGVDFTTTDRLCLDGQRLVLANGSNDDGSYWAANAEYRTEIATFSKITRIGTSYFQVETKDGRISEYGNGNNSIQHVKDIITGVQKILSWAVSSISDQHGSSIDYFYNDDVNNGDHRITSIEYAGNISIQFSYNEPRIDPIKGYLAGARLNIQGALSAVSTSVNMNLVREYRLTFGQSIQTQRSEIVNIAMCDGASPQNCVPASQFGWSEAIPALEEPTQPSLAVGAAGGAASFSQEGKSTWIADVNGDGLSDYLWIPQGGYDVWVAKSTGDGFEAAQKWLPNGTGGVNSYSYSGTQTWVADVNGDGLSDYLWIPYGKYEVWVAKSTGAGFLTPEQWLTAGAAGGAASYSHQGLYTRIADVNGDGLSDYLWVPYAGNNAVWVAKSTGDGDPVVEPWLAAGAANGAASFSQEGKSTWIADINGDGLSDYLWIPYGKYEVWVAKSTSTGAPIVKKWLAAEAKPGIASYSFSGLQTWLTDVNGDGLSDYLWIPYGKYEVWVAKSTGTGFLTPELWLAAGAAYSTSYSHEGRYTWVTDVNGDGLSDYLWIPYAGNNAIWVAKSTGDGYPVVEPWLAAGAANSKPTFSLNGQQAWMADFTGDGLLDYMWVPYTLYDIWLAKSAGSPIDVVKQITNGLSANIDVAYQPLTNKSIYTKDTDATGKPIHAYPVTDFQGAVQVVTSASTDNALGTQNTNAYEYGGMKIHKLGRGSLGFRWTETTDQDTGIKTRYEYRQVRLDNYGNPEPDFPFVENVVSVIKELPNNKIISKLTNNLVETSGFPSSPYVASSVSVEYDLDDAVNNIKTKISTVQKDRIVDSVGNLTYEKKTSFEPNLTAHIVEVSRVFNNAGIAPYEQAQLLSETSTSTGVGGVSIINNKLYTYYASGLLETETREPGVPAYELVTSYGYDGFGNPTSVTVSGADIETRTSTIQYDVSGRFPVISKNAFDHTVMSTFDTELGVVLSTTDASGLTTTQSYDGFGRPTNSILPNGTIISTTRSWCTGPCTVGAIKAGLLPQYISYSITTRYLGSDGVTEYKPSITTHFDKLGREVRSETTGFDSEILYQDTNYDGLGRVAATTQVYDAAVGIKNPTLNTNYDLLGRLRQQTSPENGTTTIDYSGLVTTTTNNGRTKKETDNAIGQLIAVEDAVNQVQTYEYNAIGKRAKTTDSMGNIFAVAYDGIGRKISMDDPDMGHWDYTYDVLGQLKTQTDAKGQTTSLEYDKLGRKIRRLDHDGTETAWGYADDLTAGATVNIGTGRLSYEMIKSATNPNFDQYKGYSYNQYGQPVQVITAFMYDVISTYLSDTNYDEYGRVDSVTYPTSTAGAGVYDRFQLAYSYQNGYLKSIDKADGTKNYWTADDRNAKGQLTLMTHGNGVVTSQVFDEAGRKTSIDVGNVASYFRGDYYYDSIGNLDNSSIFHGVGSQQLVTKTNSYDLLNRLTSVNSSSTGLTSYAYDGLGNITQKNGETYLYEGTPHAVTKVGSTVYGYDLNGNMTFGAGRSISWSPFNKPVQIEDSNTRLNFRYGIDRSRYQQTILDKSTGDTDTITYIGGLFEVVEKPTLTEYKHYIKAGNDTVAVHLRRTDASNETTYLHKDRLGSLVAVTDDSGASKAHFNYDAFGKRMPIGGEAVVNPLIAEYTRGFTGHESLDDLGLIHMNGRVYSPELGRFISADPFIQFQTNQQSYNRYSYVLNNPLGYTDPSGYWSVSKKFKKKMARAIVRSFVLGSVAHVAYTKPVKKLFLRSKLARQAGSLLSSISPMSAAAFSMYVTDISGGSRGDILKSGAITATVTYIMHEQIDTSEFASKGDFLGSKISPYFSEGKFTEAGTEKIMDSLRKEFINVLNGELAKKTGISDTVGLMQALNGDFGAYSKKWVIGKVRGNFARSLDGRGMGTYASGLISGYIIGGITSGYKQSFLGYAEESVTDVAEGLAKDHAMNVYFANGGASFGRQVGEGWQSHHSFIGDFRGAFR